MLHTCSVFRCQAVSVSCLFRSTIQNCEVPFVRPSRLVTALTCLLKLNLIVSFFRFQFPGGSQAPGLHVFAPDVPLDTRDMISRAIFLEAASLFPENFRVAPLSCSTTETSADFDLHISDIPSGAMQWAFTISSKSNDKGGHSFHVRAQLRTSTNKASILPATFVDHLNGTYEFRLLLPDAGQLSVEVFLRYVLFEGYRGYSGLDMAQPEANASKSFHRPFIVKDLTTFPIPVRYNLTLFRFEKNVLNEDTVKGISTLPLCRRKDFDGPGRWLDQDWAPLHCRLQDFGDIGASVCKDGLRLLLLGDSVARGMYFDVLELLEGQDYDQPARLKAKASRAGSFRSNASKRFDMQVELRGWSLTNLMTPVKLAEPVQDWDVVVFSSGPHDIHWTSLHRWFLLCQAAAKLIQNSESPSKFVWRSVTAPGHHPGFVGNCSLTGIYGSRYGQVDRYREAKQIADKVFKDAGINVVNMWDLTITRENALATVHFDKTYIQPGFVSKVAANMLLNYACAD